MMMKGYVSKLSEWSNNGIDQDLIVLVFDPNTPIRKSCFLGTIGIYCFHTTILIFSALE